MPNASTIDPPIRTTHQQDIMSIELLLGAEAALHFPGLVDEFTKFQVKITEGIAVQKVSTKGKVTRYT